jgi:hypothetical protein
MVKVIDLVRKSCLLRNLERINKEVIYVNDIEREINKCPNGQRIYNHDDRIPINRDCLVADIHMNVGSRVINYGDISNAIKTCSTHYEHYGGRVPNGVYKFVFFILLLILITSSHD